MLRSVGVPTMFNVSVSPSHNADGMFQCPNNPPPPSPQWTPCFTFVLTTTGSEDSRADDLRVLSSLILASPGRRHASFVDSGRARSVHQDTLYVFFFTHLQPCCKFIDNHRRSDDSFTLRSGLRQRHPYHPQCHRKRQLGGVQDTVQFVCLM